MAGSALAAGVAAAVAAGVVAIAVIGSAAVHAQRVAGAADAAALAAADAASGAITGYPCERAAEVADALQVELTVCETERLIATVEVSDALAGWPVAVRSRAGPPP